LPFKGSISGRSSGGFAEEQVTFIGPDTPDDDIPELGDDFVRTAKPVWAFPELVAILRAHGKLGRPPMPSEQRKQRVTLYLDPDMLARLKADGKGWQTRANAGLRAALGLAT
jgi:uncharacterized protein (DUF4415 family)